MSIRLFCPSLGILAVAAALLPAATYEVGPGKQFSTIGQAPWATLQPGDTVLIYWSSTPYYEKWVINRQGTAAAPITVHGVPNASGQLPIIDGANAVEPSTLSFWSNGRGIIKVGGSRFPADTMPRYITIENLEVRNARQIYNYIPSSGPTAGMPTPYADTAASIYVEKGQNITIRNCILHDTGNGLFVSSGGMGLSQNILIEGNYLYSNGNPGSGTEHNLYTSALGIVFQYNRFGPLIAGSGGENIKDRSAGAVVRYNWIEGGNRELDLVDAAGDTVITSDPRYRQTFVYGNIIVEPAGIDNYSIAHYGGDQADTSYYRKGTLYFYNNTVVSTRTDHTTLFRPSTNDERVDARNNIFYVTAGGPTLSIVDLIGNVSISHNWAQPGWALSYGPFSGTITNDGTMVVASSPLFASESGQDYHLTAPSACVNAGTALHAAVLPANDVTRQYVKHQSSEPRPSDGHLDIGALELAATATTPAAPPPPGPSPFSPIRVNAGGGAYTDPSGGLWSADLGYSGGSTYSTPAPIQGTTTATLYQSERWQPGTFSYQFAVPSGPYTVRLKFAEIWFTSPGQRVFNVSINGQQVLANFDIAAAAGANTAIDKTFTINTTTGQIAIQFTGVVQNPKVNAIEIVSGIVSPIHVNGGGGAYTDPSGNFWLADFGYSGGSTYATSSFIANSATPVLYQSERWQQGGFSYQFAVPGSTYTVRLKFAEIWFTSPGQRSFNVSINGQRVLTNFDIAAAAGAFTAIDKSFTVSASGGQILIQFAPVLQNPKVNAIEIF